MPLKSESAGLIQIHSAVLLFGLAGVLGKLVHQPPLIIVLARTWLAFLSLALLLVSRGRLSALRPGKEFGRQALVGLLLALHWWTFFKAIQVSTVAIGLLAYCSFPIFSTFLEPFFFREPLRRRDLLTAAGVSLGLLIIVWPSKWGDRAVVGMAWGIASGFLFALLSLLNRNLVSKIPALQVAMFQNGFAGLAFTLPAALGSRPSFSSSDILGLILLGVACTALAHAIFIAGLKTIKVQLAGVIAALEPVYGVVLAFLLAGEIPDLWTLGGGILIVGTTMAATYWRAGKI